MGGERSVEMGGGRGGGGGEGEPGERKRRAPQCSAVSASSAGGAESVPSPPSNAHTDTHAWLYNGCFTLVPGRERRRRKGDIREGGCLVKEKGQEKTGPGKSFGDQL